METHSWKAFYKVPMEFLIVLDSKILDAGGHPFPEYSGERACARTIFHHDITGIHGDIFDHGLTELAGAGPDRSYAAGPCDEASQEMYCVLQLFERSGVRMRIHERGDVVRIGRVQGNAEARIGGIG